MTGWYDVGPGFYYAPVFLTGAETSRTIEAEEDGPAAWCAVADSADLIGDNLRHGAAVPGGRPNAEPGGGRAAVPRSGAALI
jgi:hypothetical protein